MAGRLAAVIVLVAVLTGCDEPPYIPDIDFLSADAHLTLAGAQIVLPVVAISKVSGPQPYSFSFEQVRLTPDRKRRFRQATESSAKPLPVDAVQVSISSYGSHGETNRSSAICSRLTRQWSRHLCHANRIGFLRDLPQDFELADRRFLSSFRVGNEREAGRLASLYLTPEEPQFLCDDRFCKSVVLISPQLVAVWGVWGSIGPPVENIGEAAQRQGRAVVIFAQDAIGEHERLDRLTLP